MKSLLRDQYSGDLDTLIEQASIPPGAFFRADAATLARELLGCLLIHHTKEGPKGGFLVETEAYLPANDPGCHAARGETPRTKVMFAEGGHLYVYLIYGMYHCANIIAGREGVGTGVLLRGLEPVVGTDGHRTNGPGLLTRAMGIDLSHYGLDLRDPASPVQLLRLPPKLRPDFTMCRGTRINVTTPPSDQHLLRFTVRHNPHVSRPWNFGPESIAPK